MYGFSDAYGNGQSAELASANRGCADKNRQHPLMRILIADDHEVVRSGLRRILAAQPNWEVVAEAGDGKEAIIKAIEAKPDIAVLDYSLPRINGMEVTRQIRARLPKTEILIFTMHDSEELIQEVLRAGARGYLLKSDASRHLITAIESLVLHKPFFTAKVSEQLLATYLAQPERGGSALTSRERGVVQLIAEGHTNKQIASLLNISLKTVETHRSAIMRKLALSSSASLVRYAIRNRLVEA
jgi:DNA-binding NarL/FixJ family response regulator